MKPTIKIILLGLLTACITPVIAQTGTPTHTASHLDHGPIKIGTANMEYIYSNLPEAKQADSDLMTYQKQLSTQYENKKSELLRKKEEYEKGLASGLMPEAVKVDKEKELQTMYESIQEFEQNAEQDLQNKRETLQMPILEKIQASIDKVATANGYTHIFSTHTEYTGTAVVLYVKNKEQDNISDLVLKEMGAPIPPKATGTTTTGTTNTTTPQTGGAPVKK
jgi:outer membrane protein